MMALRSPGRGSLASETATASGRVRRPVAGVGVSVGVEAACVGTEQRAIRGVTSGGSDGGGRASGHSGAEVATDFGGRIESGMFIRRKI